MPLRRFAQANSERVRDSPRKGTQGLDNTGPVGRGAQTPLVFPCSPMETGYTDQMSSEEPESRPSGNNPLMVADQVSAVATRFHAPAVLRRGGGHGMARAAMARGASIHEAAHLAAMRQAKGHFAEVAQANQHTARAAVMASPFESRVNPLANDPLHDIQILRDGTVLGGFQVGVGSPAYALKKARTAKAPVVLLNQEAREALRESHPAEYARTADRIRYDGVETDPLLEPSLIEQARDSLVSTLTGKVPGKFMLAAGAAVGSGLEKGVLTMGRDMLLSVVEHLWTGRPLNLGPVVEGAFWGGIHAGVTNGFQTYATVRQYLDHAGSVFDARVLRAASRGAVWAGVLADILVSTARDLWGYLHGRLTFEQVLRRAGVTITGALSSAGLILVALQATRGMPPWLQLLAVAGAGWAGHRMGSAVGRELFLNPGTTSASFA